MRPLQRILLGGVLASLLLAPAGAQGRFDLPPGTWVGSGPGLVRLWIGAPEERSMAWACRGMPGPVSEARVRGRYRVTANKDHPHVSFSVEAVEDPEGRPAPFVLRGLQVRAGEEIRMILVYQGGGLRVDVFHPDTRALLFSTDLGPARP